MRDLRDDPVLFLVHARNALAGVRVLHVAQLVPDLATDIELIVETLKGASLDSEE